MQGIYNPYDGPDRVNVFYVGKHGDDANDGKHPDRAKLTIQAAINAAPSLSVIEVVDSQLYVEVLTIPSNRSLFHINAPTATLNGGIFNSSVSATVNFHTIRANNNQSIQWTPLAGTLSNFAVNVRIFEVNSTQVQPIVEFIGPSTTIGYYNMSVTTELIQVLAAFNTIDVVRIDASAMTNPNDAKVTVRVSDVRALNLSHTVFACIAGELNIHVDQMEAPIAYDTRGPNAKICGYISCPDGTAIEDPTRLGMSEVTMGGNLVQTTATSITIDPRTKIQLVTTGGKTISLPAIPPSGRTLTVKRAGSGGGNTIVNTSDAALIDGAASVTFGNNASREFVSDGANWRII